MIEGAYFSMFNEFYTLAHQAVQDIDQRAQYELFPDVMLVSSAVINSLKNNPSGKHFFYFTNISHCFLYNWVKQNSKDLKMI